MFRGIPNAKEIQLKCHVLQRKLSYKSNSYHGDNKEKNIRLTLASHAASTFSFDLRQILSEHLHLATFLP